MWIQDQYIFNNLSKIKIEKKIEEDKRALKNNVFDWLPIATAEQLIWLWYTNIDMIKDKTDDELKELLWNVFKAKAVRTFINNQTKYV